MDVEKENLVKTIRGFSLTLRQTDRIELYAEKMNVYLSKFLQESWQEISKLGDLQQLTGLTHKIIIYWTSVFREKGVLRASFDITPELQDELPEFKLMQNLMIPDRIKPRHLLLWLIYNDKDAAELSAHDRTEFLLSGADNTCLKLNSAITTKQKEELLKCLDMVKADSWKNMVEGISSNLKSLVDFPSFKTLIHPLYQMDQFGYTRILYFPIDLKGIMFGGAVLGLKEQDISEIQETRINGECIRKFKQAILNNFIYPIHSAETRATAIIPPATCQLYFPRDAFGENCTFMIKGTSLADGYESLLSYLARRVSNPIVKSFLKNLRKAFHECNIADSPLHFWDYTEEIFWCLFDEICPKLRDSKSSADLLRSQHRLQQVLTAGPLVFLCRALANELPLQELSGYRDHFAHSFHVFLVGLFLLECREGPLSFPKNFRKKSEFERAWLLAAFFHDIAYGIEKLESLANDYLLKMVGESNNNAGGANQDDFTLKIPMNSHWVYAIIPSRYIKALNGVMNSFLELTEPNELAELRSIIYKTLMKKGPDHGVLSAILLEYSFLSGSDDVKQWRKDNKDVVAKALSAMAIHNAPTWTKNDDILEGKKQPHLKERFEIQGALLRKLLVCCDELACMGRQETKKYNTVCMTQLNVIDQKVKATFSGTPWKDDSKYPREQIKDLVGIDLEIN